MGPRKLDNYNIELLCDLTKTSYGKMLTGRPCVLIVLSQY